MGTWERGEKRGENSHFFCPLVREPLWSLASNKKQICENSTTSPWLILKNETKNFIVIFHITKATHVNKGRKHRKGGRKEHKL